MGIVVCSSSGLLLNGAPLPCPLIRPTHCTADAEGVTAADAHACLLWHGGGVHPCGPGLAALARWRGHALALCADADSLALHGPDGSLIAIAPCGVCPGGMCIQGDMVCVAGGMEGCVYTFALPDLTQMARMDVPGVASAVSIHGDDICVLTLLPEDAPCTALLHLSAATGEYTALCCLPGLPGAVHADADGVWAAAGDALDHIPHGSSQRDLHISGFGCISQLSRRGSELLLTDAERGLCALVRPGDAPTLQVLHAAGVQSAAFAMA